MSSCVTGYLFIVTLREYKIFPVAGKTYSNKQSPKSMAWIVTHNLLCTIDFGLFVYAILYLREGNMNDFPEPKIKKQPRCKNATGL